jgi:hypothetical protein
MRSRALPWIASGGLVGADPANDDECQRINVNKESVMSQKVNEKQNPRAHVTSRQEHELPITGLSPDDDVGVKPPDGTGQPGSTATSLSVSAPTPTAGCLADGPAAQGVGVSHD